MRRRLLAVIPAAGMAVGSWYAYRERWNLRHRALRVLAHGAPVVMNARMEKGGLVLDGATGAVVDNLDHTMIDLSGIRESAAAVVTAIDAMDREGVAVRVNGSDHVRVSDSRFKGAGSGTAWKLS